MIDAGQIKAARALLNLHQLQLAELAGVSAATIKRIETAPEIRGAAESLWRIQVALEKCGVEFIPGDHEKGVGSSPSETQGKVLSDQEDAHQAEW